MAPSPARQRILDTAFRLFYARGLRAVGVDLLIAESGVAKATFYKYFPGKDDLVLAYLDRVDEVWTGQLQAAAAAAGDDPADQLVGLFDALGTACRREGYRGCAFLNAAAESTPGTPVHERTVAHKRRSGRGCVSWRPRRGPRDPDALARALTLLLDGGPGHRRPRRRPGGRRPGAARAPGSWWPPPSRLSRGPGPVAGGDVVGVTALTRTPGRFGRMTQIEALQETVDIAAPARAGVVAGHRPAADGVVEPAGGADLRARSGAAGTRARQPQPHGPAVLADPARRSCGFEPHREFAFRIADNGAIWSFALEPTATGTRRASERETPDGITPISLRLQDAVLGGVDTLHRGAPRGHARDAGRIKADAEA